MVRKSKKKSLLDDPATAALMKEMGMDKNPEPEAVPVKKKPRRRGKPTKSPDIKTAIEKKRMFLPHIKKQWKVLYGTNRLKASDVPGWLRGFGTTMTGDDPELRSEMITLSNLARFILTERD